MNHCIVVFHLAAFLWLPAATLVVFCGMCINESLSPNSYVERADLMQTHAYKPAGFWSVSSQMFS